MLRKLTPHAVIIIAAMYFVFFFIDRVNSIMNFINNGMTKGLLFALCVLAIYNAVLLIRENRARERQRQRALEQRRRAASQKPGAPRPDRTVAHKS